MPISRELASAKAREAGLRKEEEEQLLAFISQLPKHGLAGLEPDFDVAQVVHMPRKQMGRWPLTLTLASALCQSGHPSKGQNLRKHKDLRASWVSDLRVHVRCSTCLSCH